MVAVPSDAPDPQDTFVDDIVGGEEQQESTLSNTVEGSSWHAGLVQLPDSPSADVFTVTDKGVLDEQSEMGKVVKVQQNCGSHDSAFESPQPVVEELLK